MVEFGAAANLSISIPESELREARGKIEEELGDVSVQVAAQPSQQIGGGPAMADGGLSSVETLLADQNETLADIQDELEQIALGGGGGGGGGGASSLLTGYLLRGKAGKAAGGLGGILSLLGGGTGAAAGAFTLPPAVTYLAATDERNRGQRSTLTDSAVNGPVQNIPSKPPDVGKQAAKAVHEFKFTEPSWMKNPPTIQVDAPAWLQDVTNVMTGGPPSTSGGAPTMSRTRGGPQPYTPASGGPAGPPTTGSNRAAQKRGQTLSVDPISVDLNVPNLAPEIERAVRNADLTREIEQIVQDILSNNITDLV